MVQRALATGGAALALVVSGLVSGCGGSSRPTAIELEIRHSRFSDDVLDARVGQPLTVLLRNADPIDHEWIVGDEATHRQHAAGTEPRHDERPTEVTVDALSERSTTVTFDAPGNYRFVCHLPGHEAYGMSGFVRVS
jgi:uncharacterized cupredoxin-like copper-binding protein